MSEHKSLTGEELAEMKKPACSKFPYLWDLYAAARAKAVKIRKAEQRVLAAALAAHTRRYKDVEVPDLSKLYDAIRDLKALGWKSKS